ncbi:MAG TPA: hypothetical protein VI818_04035 [Candidatus Thermoplasmatota archaeon]|nr:hypothetical protein [Candidatus Thermoplasmatota archaeon]
MGNSKWAWVGSIVIMGAGALMVVPGGNANCDDTGACWLIPPELYPALDCRADVEAVNVLATIRCAASVGGPPPAPDALLVGVQGDGAGNEFTPGAYGVMNITVTRAAGAKRADPTWAVLFQDEVALHWTAGNMASGQLSASGSKDYAELWFSVDGNTPPGRVDVDLAVWDDTNTIKRGAVAFTVVDTSLDWSLWALLLVAALILLASVLMNKT